MNAAQPGDTTLVGPGDYKATGSSAPGRRVSTPTAVLITTPNRTLRGMIEQCDRRITRPRTPRNYPLRSGLSPLLNGT